MKKLLFLALVFTSLQVLGQTDGKNYVKTTTFQVATQDASTSEDTQAALSDDEKIEVITYYDGLGRPEQSIAKQAGGNRQDIITPMVYDAMGRQSREYLPYADILQITGSNLEYRDPTSLLTDIETYYTNQYPNDVLPSYPNPFSEKHFEKSPLNRVLEQGAPGKDWAVDFYSDNDHTIKFEYETNTYIPKDETADNVINYGVIFPTGYTEEPVLVFNGYYEVNELYKTIVKDENYNVNLHGDFNHSTHEFKNKQGQIILKRTFNQKGALDTYYVYDDYGNLTYVLSPSGSDKVLNDGNYKSFSQIVNYSEFIAPGRTSGEVLGSGSASIELNTEALGLRLTFNITFENPKELLEGKIVGLNGYLPDMIIGNITTGSANYLISVVDNALYISGSGELQSLTDSFDVSLPDIHVDLDVLNDLCYQYHYDYRNRLVEKKIPGKGWEYIVYNTLNKPVLTQDANLRANNDWLFTKHDVLGRVVYTGKHHFVPSGTEDNSGRLELQDTITSQGAINYEVRASTTINGVTLNHSNKIIPKVDIDVYTINYYDKNPSDITSASASGEFNDPSSVTINGETINTTSNSKTLPTGNRVRILNTNTWITTANYYDDQARPIYSVSKNDFLSTLNTTITAFDFVGKVMATQSTHNKINQPTITSTNRFSYDHVGRLLTNKQVINNNSEELIVKNTYDELGQLKAKSVGSLEESPLQVVDYAYNIRGWLKQINDVDVLGEDLFGFGINYTTSDYGTQGLFNGNISETLWKTKSETPIQSGGVTRVETELKRAYAYNYDDLNRIKSGTFFEENSYPNNRNGLYNLKEVDYDKNGNIIELRRSGVDDVGNELLDMDELTYNYKGNQLTGVIENGNTQYGFSERTTYQTVDYTYDENGNMIKDLNKDIHLIEYNHLNLPTFIHFDLNNDNQSDPNNGIKYSYDAIGNKLEKLVRDSGTETKTVYADGFIYEETTQGETLKFFNHPEGYVEPTTNGNFDYIYQYKDHLGNIRLSYELADNSVIIEEDYETSTYDWATNGEPLSFANQKLNFSSVARYKSINKYVNFTPNKTVHIEFDFEKGTMIKPMFFVKEKINGVWEDDADRDAYILEDGHFEVDLNLSGDRFRIYFSKASATDNGDLTTCYIDNLIITQNILEIVEENNYYPFGLQHKGYNNVVNGTENPYKYNGKELNEELGLDWYDYGARNYDPALGRWMNVDPLAELMTRHSPYNYAYNNPLRFIDPDGMAPEDLILTEADGVGTESVDKALALINEGLGGEYASIDDNGLVSLNATEEQIAGFTEEQKGFYDTINSAVTAEGDVSIAVGEGSESVLIGSYALEEIDMTDINNFGTGEAVNKFSTFGHEVKEQQEKQLGATEADRSYPSSHGEGFKAESKITGYTRQPGVAPTTSATQSATGRINGNVDVIYKNSTHTVKASINITNNNVTNVVRTKTEN